MPLRHGRGQASVASARSPSTTVMAATVALGPRRERPWVPGCRHALRTGVSRAAYPDPGRCHVGHLLARLIAANDGWAKPFGEFNHRWVFPLFHAIRPIRDFLNGTWLGHPVHPAVTDVPIGA